MNADYIYGAGEALEALGLDVCWGTGYDAAEMEARGYEYFEPSARDGEPMLFIAGHNRGGSVWVKWPADNVQ